MRRTKTHITTSTEKPDAPGQPAIDGVMERRIIALDGFRGLMTILVVLAHFFGEVPHGVQAMLVGWIAVDAFFVLSGFLIGRLIIEKGDHANFFSVFYIRRICRTFPIYFVCLIAVFLIDAAVNPPMLHDHGADLPFWTYLAFVQNFWMVGQDSIGMHWLSPSWTLAVEEQFYLIAPALLIFTPKRALVPILIAGFILAIIARFFIYYTDALPPISALVLLIPNADVLIAGLLAAVVYKNYRINWAHHDRMLRLAPVLLLIIAILIGLIDGRGGIVFGSISQSLVSAACALMILSLVRNAPEAARYQSKFLCFFGNISYAVYLTHLMVLGLMHMIFLGAAPDIETPAQVLVTIAAIPATVLLSWVLTKTVEEPITAIGRRWKWSKETVVRTNEVTAKA